MTLELINLIIAIVSVINAILGIIVVLNNPKESLNKSYLILALTVVFWGITMIGYRAAPTVETSIIWAKALYLSAIFIPLAFLYFTYIFLYKSFIGRLGWFIFFPSIFAGLLVVFTIMSDTLIKTVIFHQGAEKEIVFNKLPYFLYFIYFPFLFGWAFLIFFKNFFVSERLEKTQLKYILIGSIFASLIGMTTNLVLPTLGYFFLNWLGQIATIFFVVSIAYAITKHHLFDIKVIATELFTGLLLLVLFVNVFSARGLSEFIFNLVIFLAATIFAILLIRSVLREVKIREDLEVLTSKLEAAYQELKQLDQAKTEFMSMASHQLRTPLTAIKGYISLALENQYGEIPANLRKALNNVYASNERMIRLVNDLLTISRIELGKMVLDKKPTQIEELIQSVIEELKINAEKKGLKLFFETPEKPLPQLLIDSLKIRQVLMNLIDNAIRYTHQGFIKIRAEKKDSFVRISVQDTGEGLSEKEKTTIFSGFTRGKAGIAFFIEGAGLGLMIAKKFVELHQGKIWAESEGRGKGSVFIFELPLKS